MRTVGVILAGGVGARLGYTIPKQMVKIAGKTILEHTLDVFQSSPVIDEIVLMVTPGWQEEIGTLIGESYPKISAVLEGGSTRNDTTRRFIDSRAEEDLKVILHDAVRPLVDLRIIADCAQALEDHDAVDVVIPSADTIVEVDTHDVIAAIPDRNFLRRGQTPQAFRLPVLRRAYDLAARDPHFAATDDCGVVLTYLPEVPIKTVEGSEHNLKITHPVDLFIADKLFQLVSETLPADLATSTGFPELRGKVLVVFGGSSGIGRAIVDSAQRHGASVVSHSRSSTGVDVRRGQDIERALKEVHRDHGRIDAVVLTAGVLRTGHLNTHSPQEIQETLDVNLLAPIILARAAHPYLVESGGHLQFFTSSSYTRGREGYATYSATKAGVVNLTQALAEEWGSDGVKVNVINPERTATPMRSAAFGEEAPHTLLSAESVASTSLNIICSQATGLVVDVRKGESGAHSAAEAIDAALTAAEQQLTSPQATEDKE